MTDIKIFMLFMLDHISAPIDHTAFISIVSDSTSELSFDYEEALIQLADSGHIISDEINGEKYYMVSEVGKLVARELYDTLDKKFLEKSIRAAGKYVTLSNRGVSIKTSIKETEDKLFVVKLSASDSSSEFINLSLSVKSRMEAERIKANFESKPESVYRGILFAATGMIEYFS